MNISTSIPNDLQNHHQFPTNVQIQYYLYSQPPFGPPTMGYYICTCEGTTGLYNKHGDFLYDVGFLDPAQVLARIEERSYYNWKNHGRPRLHPTTRKVVQGMSWGAECLSKYGGSIVMYLTKGYPNRSYADFVSMITNEGYRIVEGFIEIDPNKKQY